MPGLVPGIHVLRAAKKDVDGRDKPGHDGHNVTQERKLRPSATVLAMRPAPEFCGKQKRTARNLSFRAIVEQSQRWSPAFIPIQIRESQGKQKEEKPKKKESRKAKRRQTRNQRPALRRGRAPSGALVCRRSTTVLAAASERHSSTPATRFPGRD
jgi:hypothetical protein